MIYRVINRVEMKNGDTELIEFYVKADGAADIEDQYPHYAALSPLRDKIDTSKIKVIEI